MVSKIQNRDQNDLELNYMERNDMERNDKDPKNAPAVAVVVISNNQLSYSSFLILFFSRNVL